jgi:hypothetical protein
LDGKTYGHLLESKYDKGHWDVYLQRSAENSSYSRVYIVLKGVLVLGVAVAVGRLWFIASGKRLVPVPTVRGPKRVQPKMITERSWVIECLARHLGHGMNLVRPIASRTVFKKLDNPDIVNVCNKYAVNFGIPIAARQLHNAGAANGVVDLDLAVARDVDPLTPTSWERQIRNDLRAAMETDKDLPYFTFVQMRKHLIDEAKKPLDDLFAMRGEILRSPVNKLIQYLVGHRVEMAARTILNSPVMRSMWRVGILLKAKCEDSPKLEVYLKRELISLYAPHVEGSVAEPAALVAHLLSNGTEGF